MFEAIIVIALLVILPYLFQKWITSAYNKQDGLFFAPNDDDDVGVLEEDEGTLNDVGEHK